MQHVYSNPEAHVEFMQLQGAISTAVFRGNVALVRGNQYHIACGWQMSKRSIAL